MHLKVMKDLEALIVPSCWQHSGNVKIQIHNDIWFVSDFLLIVLGLNTN